MNRRGNFFDKVVMATDLPGEVLPGQLLIEITEDRRVLIENHCGVTVYGCNEIQVKVKLGCVSVCGNHLELARMTKQQLVITGQINQVTLLRRDQ